MGTIKRVASGIKRKSSRFTTFYNYFTFFFFTLLTLSFPLLFCRIVTVTLSKVKTLSKTVKQEIKPEQQFTNKDAEGRLHDIILIKLNKDASAKLSTIKLPPVGSCNRPEQGQQVEVGGLEAANWKSEQHRDTRSSS